MSETFLPSGPLVGTVRVPGDKSISHRALLFGSLASGRSVVHGLSDGDDVLRMAAALRAFGVAIEEGVIDGGRERFAEPESTIDLGNSGTAIRLLTGVAATFPFLTVLVGDHSVHARPMERILAPLRDMGARIDGRDRGRLAPIVVRGGSLIGIDYTPQVPSAQVKGTILLAGLGATGETVVREKVATRRHSEEFLALCGAPARVEESGGLHVVRVSSSRLSPFELTIPGDPSQAAFFVVAASIVAGSELVIERVYLGPGRDGFLAVLARMGADITVRWRDETVGDLVVRAAPLVATNITGGEVAACIDELPVLAIAAAHAEGTTVIRDAAELRVKESDRIETVAAGLRALGGRVETLPDGLVITGGPRRGGRVESSGDHRIAMAFAIVGLAAGEAVEVGDFEAVATSWPSFREDLVALCR